MFSRRNSPSVKPGNGRTTQAMSQAIEPTRSTDPNMHRGGDSLPITGTKKLASNKGKGTLLCQCWCMAEILHVPQDDVWNGRTLSCGLSRCHG